LVVAYVSSSLGSKTQMNTKRAKQLAKDLQDKALVQRRGLFFLSVELVNLFDDA
jgi:hypothetical protein